MSAINESLETVKIQSQNLKDLTEGTPNFVPPLGENKNLHNL